MKRTLILLAIALAFAFGAKGFAADAVKFDKSQLVGGEIPKEHRPDYPFEARRQHLMGSAVFILSINHKTGEVKSITVQKTTGHKILDMACLTAFIKWRFKPHTVIRVWIPVKFSLWP